jgi:hypothetical protein
MTVSHADRGFFQRAILILGMLAGLSLFGYALVNAIRLPAVSPDAFVPKTVAQTSSGFPFGMFQLIFVLGFACAFLPVSVMFTIKRYGENPYGMVIGCSLLCLALGIEIINTLPFLGPYFYPEPLTSIPPDVLLYLSQTASIRYLSFDVAGFTMLYVSLLVYAAVYWKTKRVLGYLIIASVITFSVSAPFLWLNGTVAAALMAFSVFCLAPVPVLFGKMAVD